MGEHDFQLIIKSGIGPVSQSVSKSLSASDSTSDSESVVSQRTGPVSQSIHQSRLVFTELVNESVSC